MSDGRQGHDAVEAIVTKPPPSPAERLADRLNYLPIAVFGLWLAPILHLWLQLFGPMRPPGWPPPDSPPVPWFAGAGLAGIAMLLLPRGWYRPRRFEAGIYRKLGVRAFRRWATNGDAIVRIVRRRHPGFTVHARDFAQAFANTLVGEKSHLGLLMFGAVTSAYLLAIGWLGWAAWSIVTNLIGNLYPVLLQRYTRARLLRLREYRRPPATY
jgi:hypothetical protein